MMTTPKRKRPRSEFAKRRLQRAAQELSVLEFARDLEGVIQQHRLIASERVASAKRPRKHLSNVEAVEILALARILESLARQYPRFEVKLRSLQFYLRKQLTEPKARRAEILRRVKEGEMLDEGELIEATLFDKQVLRSDIKFLVKSGQLEEVNRDAEAPRKTKEGRPTDHVYYKLGRPAVK